MLKKRAARIVARYYLLLFLPYTLVAPVFVLLFSYVKNHTLFSLCSGALLILQGLIARYLLKRFSILDCLRKELNLPLYEEVLRRLGLLEEPTLTYAILLRMQGNLRGAMQIDQILLANPKLKGKDRHEVLLNVASIHYTVGDAPGLFRACTALAHSIKKIYPSLSVKLRTFYYFFFQQENWDECFELIYTMKGVRHIDSLGRLMLLRDEMLLWAKLEAWEDAVILAEELIVAFPNSVFAMMGEHVKEAAARGCSYAKTFNGELPGEEITFPKKSRIKKGLRKAMVLLTYGLILLIAFLAMHPFVG